MSPTSGSYIVITPARNEAENLPRLAESLARQTAPPEAWIIVDNGSTDDTALVASELSARHPWIEVRTATSADGPTRANATLRAFEAGEDALAGRGDFVVKVDADVSFGDDYFRQLLAAFAADPALGIASGTCYERDGGSWRQRHVTAAHVWGASRAYRRACLEDVSPLEDHLSWDKVDEIKAALRGWRTRTLLDLPFYHHRREGEREGSRIRAWTTIGDMSHYVGYRPNYVLLRALHYGRRDPSALAMIYGYLGAALRGAPCCPDADVRSFVRREQSLRQLPLRMREALGKRAA